MQSGEWFAFIPRLNHRIACCDCGLVHAISVRLVPHINKTGRIVIMKAERDNRATAAKRREARKRGRPYKLS